ncbi:type I inositol polyphosphate 5-phosphatase 5-like [Hibiscus syriacus]|uniref:type I inositol polyphosphate 5-phosphatase 5-like n=1 Tax=Hibiscus syriacus TaxID=106335 RepID=UPI001922D360|nr:type I inositol polyphosphate 5-phosphatase 5-like [Hibiscus syriacus]
MNESQLGEDQGQCINRPTTPIATVTSPDDSVKNDKKKKSFIPKIFSYKRRARGGSSDEEFVSPDCGGLSPGTGGLIEGLNLLDFGFPMASTKTEPRDFRIFVATWNVGGRAPNIDMNLEDFFLMEDSADIYVCGFQEIVPLNAGNVLVIEDNEPAAKWLDLMNQVLNKHDYEFTQPSPDCSQSLKHSNTLLKESKTSNSHFFYKPSLKVLSKNFRAESSLLKTCNCPIESTHGTKRGQRKLRDLATQLDLGPLPARRDGAVDDELLHLSNMPQNFSTGPMGYRLVASKQMVGIFLSIWARTELVPYIAHLRVSCIGTGILGRLGNKGCIAVSMTLHQTSFCFVCSHLASGEKEGDELKRNADVNEILRSTQFPKMCKASNSRAPERIIEHDRVIWLGDLNYRVALSYEKTRSLLEDNNWDALLEKDQLNIERDAGRVFNGFKEGRIVFAPTYKYSQNSDLYAGETVKSKRKRRTPAWCDRILWHGYGIEQLSYVRGETRFSDHRPVSSLFTVKVEVTRKSDNRFRKGYSCAINRSSYEDSIPKRHSFYEL